MAVMTEERANAWGGRFKLLREKKGLTQVECATALDISVKTLRNWEQGRAEPPAYIRKIVYKLLQQLGN